LRPRSPDKETTDDQGRAPLRASTLALSALYLAAAAFYLSHLAEGQAGFTTFGFPAYLVPLLIAAKIAAPLAILTRVSVPLSDLAYARIFYHLLLALSAPLDAGDGGYGPALFSLALMLASFLTQTAARTHPSPNAPWSPAAAKPPTLMTPGVESQCRKPILLSPNIPAGGRPRSGASFTRRTETKGMRQSRSI
jgi:hypothetical protein